VINCVDCSNNICVCVLTVCQTAQYMVINCVDCGNICVCVLTVFQTAQYMVINCVDCGNTVFVFVY
jgi:hypothetical protein